MKNKFTVGIVGIGYVGVPLAHRCTQVGHKVIGFDVSKQKISEFNAGKSYISSISDQTMVEIVQSGAFSTDDFRYIEECDVIVLCVPTPLSKNREPDMSYILAALASLTPHLQKHQTLCLESTTWPGTTDEILAKQLTNVGFSVGSDIFVVYSPEREDPGNPHFTTKTIPKVVSGVTNACLMAGCKFYDTIVDQVVQVTSPQVAEMTKLLENIHRSVNISLMNELKILCDVMKIDVYEVINAAASKPFGFTPYFPGPGLGGHCIPVDPLYLSWKAREFGITTKFIDTSAEINDATHQFVYNKITDVLNGVYKSLSNSKILILGVAYKKNVGDIRESASLTIVHKLLAAGADISYCDPYVPTIEAPLTKAQLSSLDHNTCNLNQYDIVIILTDHDAFDYVKIQNHAKLVIDCRGRIGADFKRIFRG